MSPPIGISFTSIHGLANNGETTSRKNYANDAGNDCKQQTAADNYGSLVIESC